MIVPRRLQLAGARLRRRVWLPGVGAAVTIGVLMVVAVTSGGSSRAVAVQPSQAEIARAMEHTTLVAEPPEHFFPAGQSRTIPDGSGGHVTAAVGTIVPTTDGDGQLVFFWHNTRFVGWDAPVESMAIQALAPVGAGRFRVTYSNYAPTDPACCPSLIPISVIYRWRGRHFVVQGKPPTVRPIPDRVRFGG